MNVRGISREPIIKNVSIPIELKRRIYDLRLYPQNMILSEMIPHNGFIIHGVSLILSIYVAFAGDNP